MQTRYRLHLRRALLAVVAVAATSLALCGPTQADEFGLVPESFTTELSTLRAGAHPDLRTRFSFKRLPSNAPAGGAVKNYEIILPKGLIGDPTSIPTCPLVNAIQFGKQCPRESMVGSATLTPFIGFPFAQHVSIYNVNPYPGEPAAFAFKVIYPVRIDTHIRPDGDYGVTVTGSNLTEAAALLGADITIWGMPADHSGPGPEFDQNSGAETTIGGPNPNATRVPLMTNPTECSGKPLTSSFVAHPWLNPAETASGEYTIGAITGCDQLDFEPAVDIKPTTNLADAPSGLDFGLHLPQHDKPVGANEIQELSVHANAGQFRLGFGGETTADLPFNAGEFDLSETFPIVGHNLVVEEALESLPAIGAGNVSVFGGFHKAVLGLFEDPVVIEFKGDLANTDVEQISVEDGTEPLVVEGASTVPGSAVMKTARNGAPAGSVGEESSTAHLRDAVVTLPEGMTVNPASANGLQSCSLGQLGMSAAGKPDGSPVNCPDASKLGTVEAVSPALDHPLAGGVYLAAQNENPFGSLLALYLVIDDPLSGVLVKLAGRVEPNPNTGRLTVSFKNNPQLPVEDLDLSFFSGPRAALKTPAACGTHTTTSVMTPWTSPEGPDASVTSSFVLDHGPDGGACLPTGDAAPNKPTFSAGTLNPTAKAFSPFVMKLTRADGTQPFKSIDATLPKGLLAKLAGTPYCPDVALAAAANRSGKAEQASSSCPAASQVGTVTVGAGAGSDPFYASGKAYLAGPYKGAPLSLAILTPAVAGPFDLGTVVVRNALTIDPITAQAHAVSDPIPTILQGIPLDIRSIAVNLSKPDFTLNPTSCDPSAVTGSATSIFGQSASLSDRFQVGDCARLGFKPSLKIKLKGGTKRSDHPALTAVLKARPGDANIAETSVALPRSEFLAQEHIRTVCTRVQFNAGAGNGAGCPKGSIYGKASAITPLLDEPLSGPVFLRSSDNPLPDLVVALHGQIDFNLVGRIDSINGGIRTSFESVPDAPVTKFVLRMQGGRKGLLDNSRNLCKTTNRASVQMEAQNASSLIATPVVQSSCKAKKKHKKAKR